MTPETRAIVESLKRIAQSKGTREDYARCSAAGLTGDWPNPQGPGMYPAAWVVLGVVEELDEVAEAGMKLADDFEDAWEQSELWRLRCEWQEAIVACMRAWNSASAAATRSNGAKAYEAGIAEHERCYRWEKAARAAYVAAGGTVLWIRTNRCGCTVTRTHTHMWSATACQTRFARTPIT